MAEGPEMVNKTSTAAVVGSRNVSEIGMVAVKYRSCIIFISTVFL